MITVSRVFSSKCIPQKGRIGIGNKKTSHSPTSMTTVFHRFLSMSRNIYPALITGRHLNSLVRLKIYWPAHCSTTHSFIRYVQDVYLSTSLYTAFLLSKHVKNSQVGLSSCIWFPIYGNGISIGSLKRFFISDLILSLIDLTSCLAFCFCSFATVPSLFFESLFFFTDF
jgi:hypothetical protein